MWLDKTKHWSCFCLRAIAGVTIRTRWTRVSLAVGTVAIPRGMGSGQRGHGQTFPLQGRDTSLIVSLSLQDQDESLRLSRHRSSPQAFSSSIIGIIVDPFPCDEVPRLQETRADIKVPSPFRGSSTARTLVSSPAGAVSSVEKAKDRDGKREPTPPHRLDTVSFVPHNAAPLMTSLAVVSPSMRCLPMNLMWRMMIVQGMRRRLVYGTPTCS